MKQLIITLFLVVTIPCYAQEVKQPDMSARETLEMVFSGNTKQIFANKEKVKDELRKEFNVTDEDLAFIFSIRGARLAYDGSDFLQNPNALLQLASLYLEAKKEWGKPIVPEFYDYFAIYAENRVVDRNQEGQVVKGKTGTYWRTFYQIDEAKRRFRP